MKRLVLVSLLVLSSGLLAQQPPETEKLLAAARENMARADRVDHFYAVREHRTDIHTNPFGRLGTGGVSVYDIYPSPSRQLTYRRLVERNGAPVPTPELAKQDADYRARVQEFLSRDNAPTLESAIQQRERGFNTRSQNRIEDIVGTLHFKVQGREVYQGVPVVVVTFTPNAQARPTTREGKIAQKFSGKIWINEAQSEVMHVEATAMDDISFGFGVVARVGEGATATMTRKPVEGGVWMPTELKISGRGRAALVRRLVIDYVLQWSDYRRLPGTSLTPFLDARVQSQPGSRP